MEEFKESEWFNRIAFPSDIRFGSEQEDQLPRGFRGMLKLLLLRRRLFSHGSRNFIEFKLLNRLRYFKRLHVYKISSIPGNIQGPAFRLATVLQQRGTETHVRCSSSFYTSAFCPSFKLFRERVKWSQFTDELVRFSQFSVHPS